MIGKEVYRLEATDSTNNYLSKLLKEGTLNEGAVVIASEQSSGRGQMSNVWESEKGKNLLMSVLLRPMDINASEQFLISKIVSISVAELLSELIGGERVKIKWPNDIYVGDLKIAGILIENNLRGANISASVVGIGLNVNQESFSENIPNPTSLKLVAKNIFDLEEVLSALTVKLNFWYDKLRNLNFDNINEKYLGLLYRFNLESKYKDENGVFNGRITGVNQYGMLCISDDDGEKRMYSFKEIEFLL